MSRRLIDCFYPVLLAISIVAMVPISAIAGDSITDRSMVPVTDFPLSGSTSRPGEFYPVRWGGIDLGASSCGYNVTGGTHDSAPSHRVASLSHSDFIPARPRRKVETPVAPDLVDQSVSISTVIMAFASVRVQQIVEPFAVVGPRLAPSRESLIDFLDWCDELAQSAPAASNVDSDAMMADSVSLIDQIVSIDRLLDSLTAEEPVDAMVAANINYVEVRNDFGRVDNIGEEPSIFVERINPLIGGSAIVVTLGSGPIASDMGDSDDAALGQLRLWSVFPTVTRPFCVRHSFDHFAADSFSITAASPSRGENNDPMTAIGDIDSMLAEARSGSIQLASHRGQADAIVSAVSEALAVAEGLRNWAVQQDVSAKRLAIEKAALILGQPTIVRPVLADVMQDLGRGIAEGIFAGKEIASQAAVTIASRMSPSSEPAGRQKAAAQLAAAAVNLDRQ